MTEQLTESGREWRDRALEAEGLIDTLGALKDAAELRVDKFFWFVTVFWKMNLTPVDRIAKHFRHLIATDRHFMISKKVSRRRPPLRLPVVHWRSW